MANVTVSYPEDKEIILQYLEDLKLGIIKTQEEKGLKASGNSAKLLRVEYQEQNNILSRGILIDGSSSFKFQEYGRGEGGSDKGLYQIIYDWLEYKKYGLEYADDDERKILAAKISSKIARFGTHTFIKKGKTEVLSKFINNKRTNTIKEIFAKKYASEILTDIKQLFE